MKSTLQHKCTEILRLTVAADPVFSACVFDNLTRLRLESPAVKLSRIDLVFHACPCLTELELVDVDVRNWSAPTQASANLRSLTVDHSHLHDAFANVASRLRSSVDTDTKVSRAQPPFDNAGNLVKLLSLFPHLETLRLSSDKGKVMPSFIEAWLNAGIRCVGLLTLELSLAGYADVKQESFHALLNALPKLQKFQYDNWFHSKRLRDWVFANRSTLKMRDISEPGCCEDYDSDGETIPDPEDEESDENSS